MEKFNKLAARYSPYKEFHEQKEKPKITHKVCSTCGRKLPIDAFYRGKGRGGHVARCKECLNIFYRKYYHTCEYYQKKQRERAKKFALENPGKILEYRKVYYERRKVVRQRATVELRDSYIIQLLLAQGLTREEITPKIIEIKREQVAASRRYRHILEVNADEEDNYNEKDTEDED